MPLLLASLLCAPAVALAGGVEPPPEDDDQSLSPYFFIDDGDPALDALPLKHTEVDVQVTGVIAEVTVRQRYENHGTRAISARYVFPASVEAAVHGMRMRIGDRTIEAEIAERAQARETYEAARAEGRTASLLEQERPNVFTMRVANVMPGDEIDVELSYTEHLIPTEGTYRFVYPTVVGPRYGGDVAKGAAGTDWVETPYTPEAELPQSTFDLKARLSTGVPIAEATVTTHRTTRNRLRPDLLELSLTPDEARGGDRDFILDYRLAGEQIDSGLILYEGEEENYFLLTVQPPARVEPDLVPPREYVFLLDVSGSMHGFPLDTARVVMRELARGLRPVDCFNVMLFSGGSRLLWPSSRPATADNLRAALRSIDEERGGGGTELRAALQRALSLPTRAGTSRSFVVVTDGYIVSDRAVLTDVRAHLGEANVFSFGIGTSVNRYLIEGIARAGLGEAFVITDYRNAKEEAGRFQRYIESPVLTDVRVRAEGFDVYDVHPKAVPDLLAARPLVVHGKWRGPRRGELRVTGSSGAGRFDRRFGVGDVSPDPSHRVLERLWARTRIAEVSDFSFGQPNEAEKQLVTELGLRHSLLTPYTSFVAVSRRIRNDGAPGEAVSQPLPLPQGVPDDAVGEMYGAPEPSLGLLLSLLLLVIVLHLGLRARRTL